MRWLLVLTLLLNLPLLAQDASLTPEQEKEFYDISDELRCPTCQGLSVLDSTATFSEQIKEQVRLQVLEGKSKSEILDFFVERYGPWILREPPKEGFNLLAWILPIAILILGPFFIWFFVWRKRQQVDSFGVRSEASIIEEMELEIRKLRKSL